MPLDQSQSDSDAPEQWRPVGIMPVYEVSDRGSIRGVGVRRGVILSPYRFKEGYLFVVLVDKKRRLRVTVHSIVAAAFIGPRPVGFDVNHKDGDKGNPRADNLEYLTRRDNLIHAIRTGLRQPPRGESVPSAKLTAEQVIAIRNDAAAMTYPDIARKYGIERARVSRICRGKLWSSVGGPIWPRRRKGNNQYLTLLPIGAL